MTASTPRGTDAVALALEQADRLVVGTARDVHASVARLAFAPIRQTPAAHVERVHDAVSAAAWSTAGGSVRLAERACSRLADAGVGAPVERHRVGRQLVSAVNALVGDDLHERRHPLAITLAVRHDGHDVRPAVDALSDAFPEATGRVAVLLHGLGENDDSWQLNRRRHGTTTPEQLAELGWTPVLVRYDTGRHVSDNATDLRFLLDRLVEQWPTGIDRLVLVGHSMGGLVARAALAEAAESGSPWSTRVSDLVCLGSPHGGALLEKAVHVLAQGLRRVAPARPFATILDSRSAGITDLRHGYLTRDEWDGHDLHADWGPRRIPLPALDGVTHHFVSAFLGSTRRHVVSWCVGDLLVREHSAAAAAGVADAELHAIFSAHHFDLLNHPGVHAVLRERLDATVRGAA